MKKMSVEEKARYFDRLHAAYRAKLEVAARYETWSAAYEELLQLRDERLDDQMLRLEQENGILLGTIRAMQEEGRQLGKQLAKCADFTHMLPLMKQGVELGARIAACTATAGGIAAQKDELQLRLARRSALEAVPAASSSDVQEANQRALQDMDAILCEYAEIH